MHEDRLDWKLGGDATKLLVAKLNELIDAVNELQQQEFSKNETVVQKVKASKHES